MYWGIDGCKGGWIAIGLSEDGDYQSDYVPDIQTFWTQYGTDTKRLLIDMPIGLSSDEAGRLAESSARAILGKRRSSVFAVPTRLAIQYGSEHGFNSETYPNACDINREIEGKAFSKQSWGIAPKIHELDTFLRANPETQDIILESHPEVLFRSLNHKTPMRYSKKTGLGFMERLKILEQYQANALDIIRDTYERYTQYMVDDDIVDALVCAVCARIGNLTSLPEHPQHDNYGLPMQMVYPATEV